MKKLFLLALAPLMAFTMHKFYVSNTTIEWNPRENSFEVTIKLFTDDFEKVLANQTGKTIRLKGIATSNDELVSTYLLNHFKLKLDGKASNLNYVGREAENDLTYCYLEFIGDNEFSQIEITNTLLTEQFSEQKNLVDLIIGDWRQSVFFTKSHTTEVINR